MKTNLIVALSENNVIGNNGTLPWTLPDDLTHFRKLTTGHTVIMGRKTFESIGRPLPKRHCIVVSRNPDFKIPSGVSLVRSLEAGLALARYNHAEEAFIIGGAALYKEAFWKVDCVYATLVHAVVEGDTQFPIPYADWNRSAWARITVEGKHEADSGHAHAFSFIKYEAKAATATKSDEELLVEANELAGEFYKSMGIPGGYNRPNGFRFDQATHPQERLCWDLAVVAFEKLRDTDLTNIVD